MTTDAELRSNLQAELARHPRIPKGPQIGIIVKNGAVTLRGVVESLDEKLCAERVVRAVRGVRAIANEIEVRRPEQTPDNDEEIAEKAARLLTWYSSLRNMSVTAEVSDAHVTLTGEVDHLYQKMLAEERVTELDGVAGVTNRIEIRARGAVEEAEVRRRIASALHRHASAEASRVRVSIIGGKVVLEGTVDAYREKGFIEEAVRLIDGVTEIVDNLQVAQTTPHA